MRRLWNWLKARVVWRGTKDHDWSKEEYGR